jgi:serine protease Do
VLPDLPRACFVARRLDCVRTTAFVIALAAMSCTGTATSQSRDVAPFLALSGSVVRVEVDREGGGLSLGTGVTIAPSLVVTNCHVTRDGTFARISGSGRLWNVSLQYADLLHDLCFLRVPAWNGKPVVLGTSDGLRSGQPVVALGFTGGTGISLRFGHVLALHSLDDGNVIESDTAFTSGASGGGLFDANGALVGLLTFRMSGARGNYYSVPVEWVRVRLPGDDQWTEVAPLHGGRAFWQRNAESLPFFMRVAALDAEGRWGALLDLADRWSSASPDAVEPLLVRGKTLQRLNRPDEAVVAFNAALRLSPDDPAPWYGLAYAYATLGDKTASRDAQVKLEALNPVLAADLQARLGRSTGRE